MATDHIRYDLLVQDALKGVVRKVLIDAARDGLPGEHHFFVSFRTGDPEVRLSDRLREKYPEEMTIVLQHQFWDLIITDEFFEVGLSFSGVAEKLHVPFASLSGFFDPSVQFGLKFEPMVAEEEGETAPVAKPAERPTLPALTSPAPIKKSDRAAAPEPPRKADEAAGAEVVSLDAFRKKN